MNRTLMIIAAIGVLGLGGLAIYNAAPNASARDASVEAQQAQETKTFAIENMTCATCPITVRKAMNGVDGVKSVKVDFEAKTATVVYDPKVTNAQQIADASTNAGYPAEQIET